MIRRLSLAILPCLTLVGAARADFSLCTFNFGVGLEYHSNNCSGNKYIGCSKDPAVLQIPAGIDFLWMFVGHTDVGQGQITPAPTDGREGTSLALSKKLGITPVWYTYIIAEGAKLALSVGDCNDGRFSSDKQLCKVGGKYIWDNWETILNQYSEYAQYAADNWGTTKPIIFTIEPDIYQYTSDTQTKKLQYADMKKLLTDIVTRVHAKLPNAMVSMDISTWANDNWWNQAVPYDQFTFMNTSGGHAGSGGTVSDQMSWTKMWGLAKKGMIADDGYGAGGAKTALNSGWSDVNNLNARISEGVVGIAESYGDAAWAANITALRPKLNALSKTCVVKPKYNLTFSQVNNGTLAAEPTGTSFDEGASVKVTATAAKGYKFSSWTGDGTGTATTTTITMSSAKTVGANFVVDPNSAVLPRNILALGLHQLGAKLELHLPVTEGRLQADLVGLDGAQTQVVRDTWVNAGTYSTTLSTEGLRPGLYLVRVRNGENLHTATFPVVK